MQEAPLPSRNVGSKARGAGWWHWQAYRTWVPYPQAVNAAIEQAFCSPTRPVVDIGGGHSFRFRADDNAGLQFVTDLPDRHREAVRLPAPGSTPEATLRHATFETLLSLDDSSGHASRLTAAEHAAGKLDRQHSLESMERTIREQLAAVAIGAPGWALSWECDVHLRPFEPTDIAACAAIEAESYPPAVVEGPGMFAKELERHPAGCWVAEDGATSAVLAYSISMPARSADCPLAWNAAEGQQLRPPPDDTAEEKGDREEGTMYLHDIAVGANARGAGVGALLLRRVVRSAQAAALPTITLTAVCGAASYWVQHGFAPIEPPSDAAQERLRSYSAECGDPQMMRRTLAQPPSAALPGVRGAPCASANCHLDPAKKERWHANANDLVRQLDAMISRAGARRREEEEEGGSAR